MKGWLLLGWWMLAGSAFATVIEGGSGLLYGPHFSYWLTAPKGWMLDNASGVSQGSNAVFYPKGQTWGNAPVVFYTNASVITPQKDTVEKMAQGEIDDFHANSSPGYRGHYSETWKLPHGGYAQVWKFEGDRWGNFEAIAFVPENKTIDFVVITARSEKLFDQAWPSFRELVLSYQWMTDDVKIDQALKSPAPSKKP